MSVGFVPLRHNDFVILRSLDFKMGEGAVVSSSNDLRPSLICPVARLQTSLIHNEIVRLAKALS